MWISRVWVWSPSHAITWKKSNSGRAAYDSRDDKSCLVLPPSFPNPIMAVWICLQTPDGKEGVSYMINPCGCQNRWTCMCVHGEMVIFTALEVWRGGVARSSSAELDVMFSEMDSLIFILHPKRKGHHGAVSLIYEPIYKKEIHYWLYRPTESGTQTSLPSTYIVLDGQN